MNTDQQKEVPASRNVRVADAARRILTEAVSRGITLRLSGGVACWERCPEFRHSLAWAGRTLKDIDLVGYFRDKRRVDAMFVDLGLREDPHVATIPGARRSVFRASGDGWHCDVFYDVLEFCHTIDLRKRLEVELLTIPLMELLLQKLQIVELNWKDVLDIQLLLREHEIGAGDAGVINAQLLSEICGRDWGMWHTVTINLTRVKSNTLERNDLDAADRRAIASRIEELTRALDRQPKTLRWKLRALLGERVRWYNQVEEISLT